MMLPLHRADKTTVGRHFRIDGEQYQRLNHRLRNEQPIKWVLMFIQQGQLGYLCSVCERHRQLKESVVDDGLSHLQRVHINLAPDLIAISQIEAAET